MKHQQELKNVLFCPLSWGLGHATRCIPIARQFAGHNYKVYFAVNNKLKLLLKEDLPDVTFIDFPCYEISYSKHKFFILKLLAQVPKLLIWVFWEQYCLRKLIREHVFNILISDNRYGCYSNRIKSILITHQLNLQLPGFPRWINKFVDACIRYLVKKFDQCWVPDDLNVNLSGALSENTIHLKNIQYIGVQSRFDVTKPETILDLPNIFWLAVLSGPEPQRTLLEKKLIEAFQKNDKDCLIVQGKPALPGTIKKNKNIYVASHLPSNQLKHLLIHADFIVCRSGYSSIMDLVSLKRTALLIPTPGQSEQEYLAKHLKQRNLFEIQSQSEINLPLAEKKLKNMTMKVSYAAADVIRFI